MMVSEDGKLSNEQEEQEAAMDAQGKCHSGISDDRGI